MLSKLLSFIIVLTFLPVSSPAGDEPPSISRSDLPAQSFVVGELKITLKRFWAGSLLSRGYIEIRAENAGDTAATFNPQRLSFVGKDGKQINVRGRWQRGPVHPDDRAIDVPRPTEIAPRAYIKELYELDGRVHLPARLFYEGKDLALILK